jgi:hypothetical protein
LIPQEQNDRVEREEHELRQLEQQVLDHEGICQQLWRERKVDATNCQNKLVQGLGVAVRNILQALTQQESKSECAENNLLCASAAQIGVVHGNDDQLENTEDSSNKVERDTGPLHLLLLLIKRLFIFPLEHTRNAEESSVHNFGADLVTVSRDFEVCRINCVRRFTVVLINTVASM